MPPNIILINCDDLGYGDLACYGSLVNDTPHLDRIARQGVRCTDFYMASPVCSPSRGAMMTGCYPPRISFGAFDNGQWVLFPGHAAGLNPSEITIARLLKDQGYATALVGKWHCGDQPEFLPTRHGFDHYYGLPYSNDMGRQPWSPDFPPLPLLRDEAVIQEQPDQSGLTERYVEECVRFIRESAAAGAPFFLYLAHMHVHLPIYPPPAFVPGSRNGSYGAAVAAVDWAAGVLLDELQRLSIDENTLVIFTSDNGSRGDHGGSNLPLRGRKGTAWEGGLRVPCILRWPGGLPAGVTCRELVTSLDFYPTFASMAGAAVPQDRIIDGRDILQVLRGESASPHEAFFYYLCNDLLAVRSGNWKLHVARDGQPICELYDLSVDLAETTDVAARYPEIVRRLQVLADRIRLDIGDAFTGVVGENVRPAGKAADPRPLTRYDPAHPYIIAMYDLDDHG
jgi:arylsulfatase A-like enzyme